MNTLAQINKLLIRSCWEPSSLTSVGTKLSWAPRVPSDPLHLFFTKITRILRSLFLPSAHFTKLYQTSGLRPFCPPSQASFQLRGPYTTVPSTSAIPCSQPFSNCFMSQLLSLHQHPWPFLYVLGNNSPKSHEPAHQPGLF